VAQRVASWPPGPSAAGLNGVEPKIGDIMKTFLTSAILGGLLCLACTGAAPARGFGGFGGFHAGGFGGYHVGGLGGYGGYHASGLGGYGAYHLGSVGSYGGYHYGDYGSAYRGYSSLGSGYGYGGSAYRYGLGGYHSYDDYGGAYRGYNSGYRPYTGANYGSLGGYDRIDSLPRPTTLEIPNRALDLGARGPTIINGPAAHPLAAAPHELRPISPAPRLDARALGTRFPTDLGLAHYSAATRLTPITTPWSHEAMANRAAFLRTNFGYNHVFNPAWYAAHRGAWWPPYWRPWWPWNYMSWFLLAEWWSWLGTPIYYDYGNTIVYQNDNVYVNGEDVGSAPAYAQQAITLADQGRQAKAPLTDEWKPLGVFALVQGDEKNSNNIFQLAVDKQGTIRGNYYDGLLDATTPVYGSVDKKTQRAAWTIGEKSDRVFETGVYNLTKNETPVLVHFGKERTQQWLLVRMQKPAEEKDHKP
jgi:hypothetical protein